MSFQNKYLKYKNKYLKLKELLGGSAGGLVDKLNMRVCSYNILAQLYTVTSLCAKEYKEESFRINLLHTKLLPEIEQNAIICLQEVPLSWTTGNLQSFFSQHKYHIIANNYGNKWNDYMGVAIAFPINIFMYVSSIQVVPVDYIKPAQIRVPASVPVSVPASTSASASTSVPVSVPASASVSASVSVPAQDDTFWETIRKKNNIIIILKLQDIKTKKQFCIGTYHSPCNFKNQKFMQIVNVLAAQSVQKFANGLPYILAGDFNTIPDAPSYNVLVGKSIKLDETPDKETEDDTWISRMVPPMQSAYVNKQGREPQVTNNGQVQWLNKTEPDPRFIGTLDYIFTSDNIITTNILTLPTIEEIEAIGPFPNKDEVSDHLLIAANLEL
jgi:mRNA deadenylase 3'-5' endonuclease subunit Ccr4